MYRVLITGTLHPVGIELLGREPDIEVDYRPNNPTSRWSAGLSSDGQWTAKTRAEWMRK